MTEIKVTKDGVSNNIIATLENAKKIYLESDCSYKNSRRKRNGRKTLAR